MTAQPRRRAAQCQMCGADTWAVSTVCDECTRAVGRSALTRNAGVREALTVLQHGRDIGTHQQDRVWKAAWMLLDSCRRQARVLP